MVVLEKDYQSTGVFYETLPSPHKRKNALVEIEMTTRNRQAFFDSFAISFNIQFHRLIKVIFVLKLLTFKWILVLPFALAACVMIFVKEIQGLLPM